MGLWLPQAPSLDPGATAALLSIPVALVANRPPSNVFYRRVAKAAGTYENGMEVISDK